ncbi:MAG: SDR family oxidoreductase [Bacteroidia bacterium]|nr:SDR family oxidoreductase [Bacteroidia bacterium]
MKILVIGATGRAGRLLVEYSLEKGHEVTAFARNMEDYPVQHPNLSLITGDVLYPSLIDAGVAGQDIVLSVIGIRQFSGPITLLSTGIRNIIGVMQRRGVKRLITITGAGILQETEDLLIMESLSFPPNLQNISLDHQRVYELLRASDLDWTLVAPAFMHNGERTGKYVVRADYYPSRTRNEVSVEDVADFITQEMTENKFLKKRAAIAHPLNL